MSKSMFCAVLCLACGLCASPPDLAHAFTYAQQLVQLEQANRAFEQALITPTPRPPRVITNKRLLGMNSSLPRGYTMPSCIIIWAMPTSVSTIWAVPSCTTGAACVWSLATVRYRPI